jgi:hypothetical protein
LIRQHPYKYIGTYMSQPNIDHRRQEVQQIVKNACDQLNAEGVDARNYVEQLAWLFFLKAFDETESRKEEEAAFDDRPYMRRLGGEYNWSQWAKNTDHPDQMLEFVDGRLWIKLTSPEPGKGMGDDALAQRFRRIFDNVRNYSRRGVGFAKVVQQVDKLHFSSETDIIVLSEIYEDLLQARRGRLRRLRRRVLHPAPHHPRHGAGGAAARGENGCTTRASAQPASWVKPPTTSATMAPLVGQAA